MRLPFLIMLLSSLLSSLLLLLAVLLQLFMTFLTALPPGTRLRGRAERRKEKEVPGERPYTRESIRSLYRRGRRF